MSALFRRCGPRNSKGGLPISRVFRRILVKAFPPHGVVVEISGHTLVYGALPGSHQGVVVGLAVGARSHTEEAVFGLTA